MYVASFISLSFLNHQCPRSYFRPLDSFHLRIFASHCMLLSGRRIWGHSTDRRRARISIASDVYITKIVVIKASISFRHPQAMIIMFAERTLWINRDKFWQNWSFASGKLQSVGAYADTKNKQTTMLRLAAIEHSKSDQLTLTHVCGLNR